MIPATDWDSDLYVRGDCHADIGCLDPKGS
ncbi:hypothetical protein AVEN_10165-1, partial [Araneus ventricosus]